MVLFELAVATGSITCRSNINRYRLLGQRATKWEVIRFLTPHCHHRVAIGYVVDEHESDWASFTELHLADSRISSFATKFDWRCENADQHGHMVECQWHRAQMVAALWGPNFSIDGQTACHGRLKVRGRGADIRFAVDRRWPTNVKGERERKRERAGDRIAGSNPSLSTANCDRWNKRRRLQHKTETAIDSGEKGPAAQNETKIREKSDGGSASFRHSLRPVLIECSISSVLLVIAYGQREVCPQPAD